MRIACALALVLLPLAGAACQSSDAAYDDRYRAPLDAGAGPSLLNLDEDSDAWAEARARDRAVYEAELARQYMESGSLSLQQAARRASRLQGLGERYDRTGRDLVWAERDLAQAERDLRQAERLDLDPVGSSPFDRADIRRRAAETEVDRLAIVADTAADRADREAARLRALQREQSALTRVERIGRAQARHEARQALAATRGDADAEIRRLLPYRHQGESIEAFRARVERAEKAAARSGAEVESLLRQ